MKAIAQRGSQVLVDLEQEGDPLDRRAGLLLDRRTGQQHPVAVDSILARGYWQPFDGDQEEVIGALVAAAPPAGASMIALRLAPGQPEALAWGREGAEQPDDLHLTLVYFPEPVEPGAVRAAVGAALPRGPLSGQVVSVTTFPKGEDGWPVIAIPSAPGLNELRAHLVGALRDRGVPFSEKWGFVPHITLAYVGEPGELPDVQGAQVDFTTLTWERAGEEAPAFSVPLEGGLVAAGWDESRVTRYPKGTPVSGKAGGGRFAPKRGPLNPADFSAPDTQTIWTGPDGRYLPERVALHDGAILSFLREGRPVDGTPTALFLAGGSGSGKTTVLETMLGGGPPGSVLINPDEFKELLPEYRQMVAAGDPRAAWLTHEESSDMAKRLMEETYQAKFPAVIDGTGDSEPGKFLSKVQAAAARGYRPEIVYVATPTDTAVRRAQFRAQETGRVVPEDEIRRAHRAVAARHIEWRDQVDDWSMFGSRDDRDPWLIARRVNGGPIEVLDRVAYDEELEKAR